MRRIKRAMLTKKSAGIREKNAVFAELTSLRRRPWLAAGGLVVVLGSVASAFGA